MNLMGAIVSLVIIGVGLGAVVAVMYAVYREKHEHEEWFIPPEESSVTQPAGTPGTAPQE